MVTIKTVKFEGISIHCPHCEGMLNEIQLIEFNGELELHYSVVPNEELVFPEAYKVYIDEETDNKIEYWIIPCERCKGELLVSYNNKSGILLIKKKE
jgi:hypothetical protein